MRYALTPAMFFFTLTTLVKAESFELDLTSLLGDNFVVSVTEEVEIDLGFEFQQITSAEFIVLGEFFPGTRRIVGPSPNTNPLVPMDNLGLLIKVGEIGTAFYEKDLFAGQSLVGMAGDLQLNLRLQQVDTGTLPIFHPAANPTTSYDALLDGEFAFSAGTYEWLASLYEVIDHPRLEIRHATLRIEGMLVPEPSSSLVFTICAAITVALRTKRAV